MEQKTVTLSAEDWHFVYAVLDLHADNMERQSERFRMKGDNVQEMERKAAMTRALEIGRKILK